MRDRAVLMQTIPPHVGDMVDYFAAQFEVTSTQAVECLVALASAMLEAREPRAQAFVRLFVDRLHKDFDVALLDAARGKTG